jgi:hypothetical protein
MITKKYVTHIYFSSNTGKYSAVCLNFFLREKTVIDPTNTKDSCIAKKLVMRST